MLNGLVLAKQGDARPWVCPVFRDWSFGQENASIRAARVSKRGRRRPAGAGPPPRGGVLKKKRAGAVATTDQVARRSISLSEDFNEMSARLDRACTIDDITALGAGPLSIAVANETSVEAVVDIWRISDNRTYADFRAVLADTKEAPFWADRWMSLSLDPGESATAERALGLGTHAVVCSFENGEAAAAGSISLIGPLDIEQ
jgi:hypothetical protein